jgi:hypothetical protein
MMFRILYDHRDRFWDWCQDHKIACDYMGSTILNNIKMDTWYIGNEKDRTWAMLRWL